MSTDAERTARLQDTVGPHYNQVQYNIAHDTAMVKINFTMSFKLISELNLCHFVIFF